MLNVTYFLASGKVCMFVSGLDDFERSVVVNIGHQTDIGHAFSETDTITEFHASCAMR